MRPIVAAVVLFAGLAFATTATTATSTAPTKQLSAYLQSVAIPRPNMVRGDTLTGSAVFLAKQRTVTVAPGAIANLADQAITQLQIGVDRLASVSAPASLRGPQASLHAGLTAEIRLDTKLAAAMAHIGTVVDVVLAASDADAALAQARDEISQWRVELIVQLRRRGITVPLWLKNFGR